ncbi:excinuclease ABC subunit C [Salirhabdus sp. Marseille-P4669]|uniref:excinuclease ABC subunit C n=1 Tax=Salirhabdus sp. Marseille-P4669 TaxID=2042310 RepID=UPI001F338E72|nr:excinuclease ABC subunit C [Salirhabdus sp. Marseille-P4669]
MITEESFENLIGKSIREAIDKDMLSVDELTWIRHVLEDNEPNEISPLYFHIIKTKQDWLNNKDKVKKELDKLRGAMLKVTPQELLKLKNKSERERQSIKNFSGIYIIHNYVQDKYYIGQAEKVFDRAYMHFVLNSGNIGVYEDFNLGDDFCISLIPLENTRFSSLNELEGYAIIAYNSLFPNGYNKVIGNILDKPIFKNSEYAIAADLLLSRIIKTKGKDFLLTLTNGRKRMVYTSKLFSELGLPLNLNFHKGFRTMIKEYKNNNNKSKR